MGAATSETRHGKEFAFELLGYLFILLNRFYQMGKGLA